ncbi:MAG: hypothetical protein AAF456_14125 [Planctomycetota bacterium]
MSDDSNSQSAFHATDDSRPDSLTCAKCSALLVADQSIGKGAYVRCYRCGDSWARDEVRINRDRMAWWSLWLGIASIMMICFSGFPAIYFGIRSLMRMKHRRVRPRDRSAAVIGTTFGVFFGIFWGFTVAALGAGFLVARYTSERSEDPERIAEMVSERVSLELPDRYIPNNGLQIMGNQLVARYFDAEDAGDRTSLVMLMYFTPMMHGGAGSVKMTVQEYPMFLLDHESPDLQSEEKFEWEMCGDPVTVTKRIFVQQFDETNLPQSIVNYYCFHTCPSGIYGLRIDSIGEETLTDEEAREIFASLGPPDQTAEEAQPDADSNHDVADPDGESDSDTSLESDDSAASGPNTAPDTGEDSSNGEAPNEDESSSDQSDPGEGETGTESANG